MSSVVAERSPTGASPHSRQSRDSSTAKTGQAHVARGAAVLTATMFVANAGNYGINVVLGRWLTPAQFADATLIVTLMLVATAFAISLQLIAAKLTSDSDDDAIRWLNSRALMASLVGAAALVLAAPALRSFFHTASATPFIILAFGLPFYAMQAVGRGVLQGRMAFGALAKTFGIEVFVRALISVVLVVLRFGVLGATAGLTVSFVVTWFAVREHTGIALRGNRTARKRVTTIARPVALLLAAQVIINNEDVLFAKRYLPSIEAGKYSAIALIGRGVFFASWAVATAVFPAAAARTKPVGHGDRLLFGALFAVSAIGTAACVGAITMGNVAMGNVFGNVYRGLSAPLALYAVLTTLFAAANLFATYHLSMNDSVPSLMLLLGAGVQTALLIGSHETIAQFVNAQLLAMSTLAAFIVALHCVNPRISVSTRRIVPA